MQVNQVLPHQSQQTISVWTMLCARGHCHAETGKGLPQSWKHRIVYNVFYAVALRFPFTGTKGPSPNHGKQPQNIIPQTIIPPNPDLSVGLPVGEA